MSVQPGQSLLHYRIVDKIGEGGMGEVYLAQDTKLGREVAIKVLPASMAQDESRVLRFEREARAVAALNHPNIVGIYAVEHTEAGEGQPLHFLSMELVRGQPLSKLIPADGLPMAELLDLALPLTDALAAAHRKGIVHRDLKPDNVILNEEGRLKVLDFGLAKLREDVAPLGGDQTRTMSVTREGKIVGTFAYMSPEQVQAKTVDARSDVFSLGILLYEMATGKQPFEGENSISVISSILKDESPSLVDTKPEAPRLLEKILHRCLEKKPGDRYDSAAELHGALKELRQQLVTSELDRPHPLEVKQTRRHRLFWGFLVLALVAGGIWIGARLVRSTGEPATGPVVAADTRRMMVVFPFDNLGPQENDYFAAGITDEIISRLSTVAGIGVISRTSSVGYDRRGKTIKDIGADLGVDYVLEGTIRWNGQRGDDSQVRVLPSLVRVSDDTSVWSGTYDRKMDDIFGIQSEIAESVVGNIDASLIAGIEERTTVPHTANLDAYDLYLQAAEYFSWGYAPTEDQLRTGAELLERAVTLDPDFAIAHAKLSEMYSGLYFRGFDATAKRIEAARQAADRALELRQDLVEGHLAKGLYHYRSNRDYERALVELDIAHRLGPSNANVLAWTGVVYKRQGRFDEAVASLERALKLDPQNPTVLAELAVSHQARRDYTDALAYLDRVVEVNPTSLNRLYRANRQKSVYGSTEFVRRLLEELDDEAGFEGDWINLLFYERKFEQALARVDAMDVDPEKDPAGYARKLSNLASISLAAGERERAKAYAERAVPVYERLGGDENSRLRALAQMYAIAGRADDAKRTIDRFSNTDRFLKDVFWKSDGLRAAALTHVWLGNLDTALGYLDRALAMGGMHTTHDVELDPHWDPLRDQPGYAEMIARYPVDVAGG